ncbi:hypothetical protein EDD36DRAFT_256899 [Exophiala viscosa]|uniref:DNA repair protein Rad26 n=1 Tax=Exophiala viscosa TaxID=2486360 RepID=A0AAN6IDL5_9EURO|nr:hypothetical protein EDD36DRAFT_256899 [Exophiala viscosa]
MNGMDDNEDETDLFDDDFDGLSETALQELEQHALLSTQQQIHIGANPAQPAVRQPQPLRSADFADDSFEIVGDEGVPTPAEEYDAYPLRREAAKATPREQFRQHRYGQAYDGVQKTHNTTANTIQDEVMLDIGEDRDAFRGGVDELLRERNNLTRELRNVKDAALMQKGEISIIRANFDKESKVFDRQIGSLKKTMEEEQARHTAVMNAMVQKNNNLTTQYNFLQQEHQQGLQETRTLKQRLKERPQSEGGPVTTPKHGVMSSLRDGFEDDDVMVVSPSKSNRRSKPPTPSERKRKADGTSPIKPLVLRPTAPSTLEKPAQEAPQMERVIQIVRKDKRAEKNLRFLQSILDYRAKGHKEPLLESLVQFSLPSSPKTFSTILLEGTAHLKQDHFCGDLSQIFIDLWSKSIKEQYYQPISLLVEVVNHLIDADMTAVDAGIVTTLTPLLQSTVAINAEKRVKHSPVNHSTFGKFRQTPQSVLNHEVKSTPCLELLLTMAYIISDDHDLLTLFWRLVNPEFVLMMLNAWQPIADITLILRLLATSTFTQTFGSICVNDQQAQIEQHIMNRICYLLWETPKVDEGLPPNTAIEIAQFRVEVMDLLVRVAISSSAHPHDDPTHHGSQLIASHPSAIARIVRSLYDEVAAMYDLTPSHALHAEIVNKGIQVLFRVLELHGSEVNLQEKLSVINGGVHKHRVVLTRLAFSEGFYIDRLITDDTVAMATSMLEESVTPDEADELIEAFPGFKGRGHAADDE